MLLAPFLRPLWHRGLRKTDFWLNNQGGFRTVGA
jgi:hypothetical protein